MKKLLSLLVIFVVIISIVFISVAMFSCSTERPIEPMLQKQDVMFRFKVYSRDSSVIYTTIKNVSVDVNSH